MADIPCSPNKKKLRDYISWRDASYMVTIVTVAVGIVIFFWGSQADQDEKAAKTTTQVSTVEISLKDHVATSNRIFESIDSTMTEQRQVISATRETLSGVSATQVAIKEENGRLATAIIELTREIRKSNGGKPTSLHRVVKSGEQITALRAPVKE